MRAGERKTKAVETWRGEGDQLRLVGEGLDGRNARSDRREKWDGGTKGSTRRGVVPRGSCRHHRLGYLPMREHSTGSGNAALTLR